MVPIANIWTIPKTSWIFMKSVDVHKKLCPAVSCSYLEGEYVENMLSITDPAKQSYKVNGLPQLVQAGRLPGDVRRHPQQEGDVPDSHKRG